MAIQPYKEERPWGNFVRYTHNEPSTVKILTINPGEELSLQYHNHREEYWHFISGKAQVVIGDTVHKAHEGTEFTVPPETKHMIRNLSGKPIVVLEIAFGDFDESDIVRLKDKYQRKNNLPST